VLTRIRKAESQLIGSFSSRIHADRNTFKEPGWLVCSLKNQTGKNASV